MAYVYLLLVSRSYYEGVCVLRRSSKRQHVPSKYEAGLQKCCQQLANRREGGASWGPIPLGGVGPRNTSPYIYIYIHTDTCVCVYIYTRVYIHVCACVCFYINMYAFNSYRALMHVFRLQPCGVGIDLIVFPMSVKFGTSWGQLFLER